MSLFTNPPPMEQNSTMTYLKSVATLKLDAEACTGCGVCLDVCPSAVFRLNDGKPMYAD